MGQKKTFGYNTDLTYSMYKLLTSLQISKGDFSGQKEAILTKTKAKADFINYIFCDKL